MDFEGGGGISMFKFWWHKGVAQNPKITTNGKRRHNLLLSFILTANGNLAGGSGYTVRHNKQITHITQNNTTIKRNREQKTTYTIKDTLHRINTNNHNYKQIFTTTTKFWNIFKYFLNLLKDKDGTNLQKFDIFDILEVWCKIIK
jgi:hypothetical protein